MRTKLPFAARPARHLSVLVARALVVTGMLQALPVNAAPTVVHTEYIGPFTGHDAAFDPADLTPSRLQYYGTDLGFSYQHKGQIVFLFGDTWATEAYAPIQKSTGSRFDDGWGTIELAAWADSSRISRTHMPTVRLARNPGTDEMAAMNPGQAMDLSKTPLHGFSNGSEEFAIFLTAKPQGCAVDSDCGGSLSCDVGLGYAGVPYTEEANGTAACIDGSPGCTNDTMSDKDGKPIPHTGFCVDAPRAGAPTSDSARVSRLAMRLLIGSRSHLDPRNYEHVQAWLTSRFFNVTARTVQRFTSSKNAAPAIDYRTAGATGGERRVLLWGRPGFVGVKANHRPLDLYFGYVDLPTNGEIKWQVHYFSGVEQGVPQFSVTERDAAPIDTGESHDVVNQMSMSWVAPLKKWVMFYGGGVSDLPRGPLTNCGVLQLFAGSDCKDVSLENGAVRMRTADQPWGPWSAPQDVIAPGDSKVAQGQYGAGGALHSPHCQDKACATPTRTPFYLPAEYGFFYAANIIEEWTRPVGKDVELLWNVSTWDPYRVVLMRTRIAP
jgi:hypothetical protein